MSFRTVLLARVDAIRGLVPKGLDLRQNAVYVLVRTWSGGRPGSGTSTDVRTRVTNAGGANPKVSYVNGKDIVASGGLLASGDYKIGPISQAYLGGGTDSSTLDPVTSSQAKEIYVLITGNGFPTNGSWCTRVSDESLANFHMNLFVRATGKVPSAT